MARELRAECLAEFFGTFALVFAGTGAIVANEVSGGAVGHVGISLTFGLIVMALIYGLGELSGAHFNPAVTLGFFAAGRFPGRQVLPFVVAQCVGAIAASLAVRAIYPATQTLGQTLPHDGAVLAAFVLEVLLTFFLMLVILRVSTGSHETGIMAGAAIGALIACEALFAGPISGASMNPARSLGPALVGGTLGHLWAYLVAPTLGALLAVPACRLMPMPGCCNDAE